MLVSLPKNIFNVLTSASMIVMASTSIASAKPVYMLQLGSFETETQAKELWENLDGRFPDLFNPLEYYSSKIQLPPDDFVYHRTQAGPLEFRKDAEAICDDLLAGGFECYVVETALFSSADENSSEAFDALNKSVDTETTKHAPSLSTVDAKTKEAIKLSQIENAASEDIDLPKPSFSEPITQAPSSNDTAVVADDEKPEIIEKKETANDNNIVPTKKENTVDQNNMPWKEEAFSTKKATPATIVASRKNGTPFQKGESRDHLPVAITEQPTEDSKSSSDVPPTPSINSDAPLLTGTPSDDAQVKVSEAVRVPLTGASSVRTAPIGTLASRYKGLPSQSFRHSSLWAEMSYFTNQRAALNYWNKLNKRSTNIPNDLRLRTTKPFAKRGAVNKISLRVGPFNKVEDIRNLCGLTRVEQLRCRAVKDLGASIAANRGGRRRISSKERYGSRKASNIPNMHGYWLQLGAYDNQFSAQSAWNDVASLNQDLLKGLKEHVAPAPHSSASETKYRLRTGPFTSSLEAIKLCSKLRDAGERCAVVSNR